jgi:hypothetical protein
MLKETTLCEELFHTASGLAYADFITDGHRETWPIRSKRFRIWLRRCYYQATGAAAGATVIGSALDLLEARAQFDAPERTVSMRIAEHAGCIYTVMVGVTRILFALRSRPRDIKGGALG